MDTYGPHELRPQRLQRFHEWPARVAHTCTLAREAQELVLKQCRLMRRYFLEQKLTLVPVERVVPGARGAATGDRFGLGVRG